MKIAFCTLGCKVNQFDTAAMQSQARAGAHDVVEFEQPADVYVINTCSVTGRSNHESRQLVRRALRSNPHAKVVVTGCYAQTHPRELMQIDGVTLVLGTQERNHWLTYLGACEQVAGPVLAARAAFDSGPPPQPLLRQFDGRARFFLKVQDGCDFDCSFCIIPRARGPSRTVPPERVLEQVALAVEHGYQEIVLTGVNLGLYGRDLRPKWSLARLVERILIRTSLPRLRLSSIEPKTVTPALVELFAAEERLCRHFHIPLQSGDAALLVRMRRHYTPRFYRTLIERLAHRFDHAGFGTDVLVGFPGETEARFENTYRLLQALPFGYFHVFPFSPRPQTPAERMRGQVAPRLRAERVDRLQELARAKARARKRSQLGRMLRIAVEHERAPCGRLRGYSDGYVRVVFDGPDGLRGHIVPVRAERLDGDELVGRLLSDATVVDTRSCG